MGNLLAGSDSTGYFYIADRYSYQGSGEIILHVSVSIGGRGFVSFRDTKSHPLETRISDIRSLLRGALDIKAERKAAEGAAERRRREEGRQERIRKMREAHVSVISRLESEAGAWERAQRLRRYLRAARRSLLPAGCLQVVLEGDTVDLFELRQAFADQLDPLHPSPRTGIFFDESDPYATGVRYETMKASSEGS